MVYVKKARIIIMVILINSSLLLEKKYGAVDSY